jgi:hypothetical protein
MSADIFLHRTLLQNRLHKDHRRTKTNRNLATQLAIFCSILGHWLIGSQKQ